MKSMILYVYLSALCFHSPKTFPDPKAPVHVVAAK
jgi:hypothetical protein